jgi:hypothetical protein
MKRKRATKNPPRKNVQLTLGSMGPRFEGLRNRAVELEMAAKEMDEDTKRREELRPLLKTTRDSVGGDRGAVELLCRQEKEVADPDLNLDRVSSSRLDDVEVFVRNRYNKEEELAKVGQIRKMWEDGKLGPNRTLIRSVTGSELYPGSGIQWGQLGDFLDAYGLEPRRGVEMLEKPRCEPEMKSLDLHWSPAAIQGWEDAAGRASSSDR